MLVEAAELGVHIGGGMAVRSANLSLARGDRVGLVGESGCGKSMTGLALMGMTPAGARVEGSIRIEGAEMAGASEQAWRRHRARTVAMIFQEPMSALNPIRTVGETLMEPLGVHLRLPRSAARARALELLEEVGVPDPPTRMRQYPHQLSGGQRQRVLIALALSCDPALLIADEPTTALDANVALRIIDLLVRLSETRHMALLLISHDFAAVARATHDIIVMYGGDMVERGPTGEVLRRPRHPYTQGLLAARPQLDVTRLRGRRLPTIRGSVPPLAELAAGCRFSGRCPRALPECAALRPAASASGFGTAASCHLLGADLPIEPAAADRS